MTIIRYNIVVRILPLGGICFMEEISDEID